MLAGITTGSQTGVVAADEPLIEIPQGKLSGNWKNSYKGRKFAAFEGIPYGRPPVGRYRFEPPIPANGWKGIWQAKFYPNICLQWNQIPGDDPKSLVGDEDCLYLNVYSPNLEPEENLPVLVFIHGGSFVFGAGVEYGPRFLLDHDIVYVSINYRLGFLGFLSTQDEVVPGNNGLKDQNLALKWIQDNIKYFGGDPSKVTIMGMSAGAASVHYHMLSKSSHGLFHRAISQSGTSLCPWTQQTNPREKAYQLGKLLGCPTNNSHDMIECLKYRPAGIIVRSIRPAFMVLDHTPFAPLTPVIEPVDNLQTFLMQHPYEIIQKKGVLDVPWMTSIVTKEGLYPGGIYLSETENIDKINSNWNELVPHIYDFNNSLPKHLHHEAADKIKQKYLNGEDISSKNKGAFLDSLSDRHFTVCLEKTVKIQSLKNKEPTYVYVFDYSGKTSLRTKLSNSKENHGVCHGDDTGYSLDTTYMDPTTTEEDRKMIEFKSKLIASFVVDGKPDVGFVEWKPVNIENGKINYLKINSADDVRMETAEHFGETEFWDSLGILENEALFQSKFKEDL